MLTHVLQLRAGWTVEPECNRVSFERLHVHPLQKDYIRASLAVHIVSSVFVA